MLDVELHQRAHGEQLTVSSCGAERDGRLRQPIDVEGEDELPRRARQRELVMLLEQHHDVIGARIIGTDDHVGHRRIETYGPGGVKPLG